MSEWQDITTAPRDGTALFWIVPKTAEESYCDTDGKPIVGVFRAYLKMGSYNCWGALSKATHWMPLPSPPVDEGTTTDARLTPSDEGKA